MLDEPDEDDLDDRASRDAMWVIVRRAVAWAIPLGLIALLLVALGLPAWFVIPAVAIAYLVAVLELEI